MKRCLLLLGLLLLWVTFFAQPVNDECSTATVVGSANLDDGSMTANCVPLTGQSYVNATPWETAPGLFFSGNCWGGGIDSVVFYSFVAQGVSGSVEVTNGPSTPKISVVSFATNCTATGAVEVGCAVGGPVVFDNDLVIGNTYYVIVGFQNSTFGTFDICVFNPQPAPNDDCMNAIPLANIDGTCNTNLTNYFPSSDSFVPGCFPAGESHTVWYSFDAVGVSIAELYISGLPNAHVAVVDFSSTSTCNLPAGVVLACQTNVNAANPIVMDNTLTIGNTYYIVVAFGNNATGSFSLCLDNPVPAFNDDCMNAEPYPSGLLDDPVTCHTVVNGTTLNNDWPSSDIGVTYGCWAAGSSYNVWFSFTAQGPNVDVTVDAISFSEAQQIAVVEFTGAPCDPASWAVFQCRNGSNINIDNALVIGQTYYVVVGFANNGVGTYCINIFNPLPALNDQPCNAIDIPLNGLSPVCANPQPTTQYASPDFNPNSFPPGCQVPTQSTVWYTIQMSDPNNVGFAIDVASQGLTGDVSVVLFEEPVCSDPTSFGIAFYYCGPIPAVPLEWGPINETSIYYLMIGSSDAGQGNFSVCVSETPPCFMNNFCDDPTGMSSAEVLMTPETQSLDDCSGGDPFVCVIGCNHFADPEPGVSACIGPNDPVVWYTFSTDAIANLLNVTVTSADILAPTVSVFYSVPGVCGNWIEVACQTGSSGEVSISGIDVGGLQTYFVAVSGINTFGGEFEMCINTIAQITECVVNTEIDIVGRSLGTDLDGPFFPGEEIDVCLRVINYTASNNNCQWFQGIVPIFGNGWDLSQFDPVGGATLNGQTFPRPALLNSGTWDWWTDVTYHHDHCYYNVGDFNGDGWTDMCNGLYDQDCTGPGLTGGCCPSCWTTTPGAPLPPGWFTSGVTGLCGADGHPTVDWGDGNNCSFMGATWNFCFTLQVKDFPQCQNQQLSLGFVTFADGEVGSWQGTSSVCGADAPEFIQLPLCCNDITSAQETHPPFCAGGVFSWTLNHPEASFWTWTVDAPATIVGESSGSGPSGTIVIDNLTNTGTSVETATYHFLGFQGGECPSVFLNVVVEIFPEIEVEMMPFTVCSTPSSPYVIIPDVQGGDPGTYQYLWHDGSMAATFTVANPVAGQQYAVTVTDNAGCSNTAVVTLNVYTTFPVDITASELEKCFVDGPIDLEASATGGLGSFTYTWEGPSGQIIDGSNVSAHESGQWLVIVEDSDGCRGRDSVMIRFHDSPEIMVSPQNVAVCPNNPSPNQIQALVTGGETPYFFEWLTPGGLETTPFILVTLAGQYSVTVTDANGCTNELDFAVFEQESPEPDIPEFEHFCPEDLVAGVSLEVPFDPTYTNYNWGPFGQGANMSSITIYDPGLYPVTISNQFGCRGVGTFEVNVHAAAQFEMPDTIRFCIGNFTVVDAEVGWVGSVPSDPIYEWSGPNVGGGEQEQYIFDEGLYFITATDDNGCSAVSDFWAVAEDQISIDIIGDSVICNGVPAIITASDFATYLWSTGQTSQSITVMDGDQYYYITVSDGDGCFGQDSVYVPESSPSPGILGQSVCEGEAATLDVGAWPEILWSTGHTTSTISTNTAGTFTVTVTDALGCTNTASYTATIANNPEPDIQGVLEICAGTSTSLNAGGTFDSYMWSTSATTPDIIVNTPGIIWVMVTSPEGCVGYDTVDVIVNGIPMPSITGDTSICNSVAVQLDAGTGYMDYQWSVPGTGQTVDVDMPGTYSVTVTDAEGCTGVDQIVVVASAPTPVISGVTEVCEGENGTLTATAGFMTYAWSGGGSGQTLVVNSSGTYTVTVTDIYGCQSTAAHQFIVHPNPAPVINGSATYCPGEDTELDAGAGYDFYSWSNGGTSQLLTVSIAGTYSVTVTDMNNCTGTTSINVIESNELTINPPDQTICAGDMATLTVGNFDTYQWSTGATTPTIDVMTAGTYFVTVTDAGCMGTADIAVTVNPEPFATVTATAEACDDAANGSTIDFSTLITGGDAGGTWVDVDNSGATGNFPMLDFDGVAHGTYTFQYTTASALPPCTDVSYTIEVSIGTSPELSAAPDLCNDGDQLDLSTLVMPGVPNGSWTIVGTPAGSNPATLSGTMFNAVNADPGTYTVQYQISGIPGSCPDTETQTIVVNPEPDAGFASAPAQICVGEDSLIILNQLLQGADPGGMWIETSSNPSTGNAFNNTTGTFRTQAQNPGTYTFEYILDGSDPCPDASATVEVVVENVPVADAGVDASLTCEITSVMLGGAGSSTGPEFSYLWTTTNGVVVNPNVLNPTVTKSGIYTLTVINNNTGCESQDEVEVNLEGDIPTDLNLIVYSPECKGDPPGSAQVTAVVGGTPPYAYSLNGAPATSTPNWTTLQAGDYTLVVTDDLGCKYETQFSIGTANDLAAELTGEILIEIGDDATLSYVVTTGTADSTVWFIDGTATCINCSTLVFTPVGQTQVQLTIFDERDCEITLFTTIQVHITRNIFIPNIFSPNGDNINDFFTIYASDASVLYIDYLQVFTRWGDKVFEIRGILPGEPTLGWDGTFDGRDLNPGVYVYHAKVHYADDLEEVFKGDITLIR